MSSPQPLTNVRYPLVCETDLSPELYPVDSNPPKPPQYSEEPRPDRALQLFECRTHIVVDPWENALNNLMWLWMRQ